jgi:hypothetical protein
MHISEAELEQCFEFIRTGEGAVDVEKWVSAFGSSQVKSIADSIITNVYEEESGINDQQCCHQQSVLFRQQQDNLLRAAPSQEYWMVKGGGEVKAFEWHFIERRLWVDPVDVWLRAEEKQIQEVGYLGSAIGLVFIVPIKQTTKGLMKQWQLLKHATAHNSHDIGFEQLQELLRICRISATESEIKKMFEAADEDGSGTIDSHEFLTIVKRLQIAGGSTGVDSAYFVKAVLGPSPAMSDMLACAHKRVLECAGSSSQKQHMFHVQFHESGIRPCELRVKFLISCRFIISIFCMQTYFFRLKKRWILFADVSLRRIDGLQVVALWFPFL